MFEISELERREIIESIDDLLAALEGEEDLAASLYWELERLKGVKRILRA